jgi:hypothetical protein
MVNIIFISREDPGFFVLQSFRFCCSTVGVTASGRPLGEFAARSEFLAR